MVPSLSPTQLNVPTNLPHAPTPKNGPTTLIYSSTENSSCTKLHESLIIWSHNFTHYKLYICTLTKSMTNNIDRMVASHLPSRLASYQPSCITCVYHGSISSLPSLQSLMASTVTLGE